MSKIYDALLRAELDRAANQGSRTDQDSPEATLTRDILASLNQTPQPITIPEAEEPKWEPRSEPTPVQAEPAPEPVVLWNPNQSPATPGLELLHEPDQGGIAVMKTCPNCSLPYGARTERKGIFQKHIASFFGYFPWMCKACRVNFYSKDRGIPTATAPTAAATPQE